MPRPRIRPTTPEAAAAGQAALDSFGGTVFVPEGAAKFDTKSGVGRRWSARLEIIKANVSIGGSKEKPNENEAVFYLLTKTVPFPVDADKAVPVGTTYHLRVRVNYDLVAEGNEMAIRNDAVMTSLYSALGVNVKDSGITEAMIQSAFPEKSKENESTLRGQRLFASLSLNPPKEGKEGQGYLNVDRFLPDSK